jgi:tetratricopeptide (TPR) repeat protein
MRDAVQNYLELASELAGAGLHSDAGNLLAKFSEGKEPEQVHPLVNYLRGYCQELNGEKTAAAQSYAAARRGSPVGVFPHRLEEQAALEAALRAWPRDAMAHLFLGNLLYGSGQLEAGLSAWQKAVEMHPRSSLALRNVGYGLRRQNRNLPEAHAIYQKAFAADPADGRILLELDEIAQQIKVPAAERYALFTKYPDTINSRDDLISTLVDLRLKQGGDANLRAAYDVLKNHHFHSWEGKYEIHYAWVEVNQKLGDAAFGRKDYRTALTHFRQAGDYPKNLEVAARTPDFRAHVNWDLARAHTALGAQPAAQTALGAILAEKYGRAHLGTYYQAMANKSMGRQQEYQDLLGKLEAAARQRTSGYENRGRTEAIGHYLLSLVLAERGDSAGAGAARQKALSLEPAAARLVLREAQLDFARAHQ